MKARGVVAVLACAAAGALTIPTGAAAKPGYGVVPGGFFLSATLPKSNGYRVHLGALNSRWIEMSVYRQGTIAIYLARGKVNRHGVSVDFGRFGHVRADFVGDWSEGDPVFPGCRGRRAIEARGRLEGSFRFRGEGDYVSVSATRAKTFYERTFKQVCFFGSQSPRDRERVDVLEATGEAQGRKIEFSATYLPSIKVPVISASITERVGRVIAVKLSMTSDEEDVLEFDPPRGHPQTVTVAPTFPFRGSASYAALPDGSATWSGDLRVPLAGIGQVPVTGSGFRADACRVFFRSGEFPLTCKPQPESAHGAIAFRRLLYGSGSHSQPLALARLSSLR